MGNNTFKSLMWNSMRRIYFCFSSSTVFSFSFPFHFIAFHFFSFIQLLIRCRQPALLSAAAYYWFALLSFVCFSLSLSLSRVDTLFISFRFFSVLLIVHSHHIVVEFRNWLLLMELLLASRGASDEIHADRAMRHWWMNDNNITTSAARRDEKRMASHARTLPGRAAGHRNQRTGDTFRWKWGERGGGIRRRNGCGGRRETKTWSFSFGKRTRHYDREINWNWSFMAHGPTRIYRWNEKNKTQKKNKTNTTETASGRQPPWQDALPCKSAIPV